jgi:hypothetical protein
VIIVLAASYGWQRWSHRHGPPDPAPGEVTPWFGPRNQQEAVNAATVQIDGGREREKSGKTDWLHMEILGDALVGRYRLTGSYADLAEADKVLDRAIGMAEFPAGPSLSRAALSVTLHRLDDATKALARFDAQKASPHGEEASSALALRGTSRCSVAIMPPRARTMPGGSRREQRRAGPAAIDALAAHGRSRTRAPARQRRAARQAARGWPRRRPPSSARPWPMPWETGPPPAAGRALPTASFPATG